MVSLAIYHGYPTHLMIEVRHDAAGFARQFPFLVEVIFTHLMVAIAMIVTFRINPQYQLLDIYIQPAVIDYSSKPKTQQEQVRMHITNNNRQLQLQYQPWL